MLNSLFKKSWVQSRSERSSTTGQAEKKAEKIAKKFLRLLKKKNCYLEVYLVSSQKMKFLNKKFRGPARKRVSDILSFKEPKNFPHPESQKKFLGEIYLNTDSPALSQRLSALLAHGVLHLLGFQHYKRSDRIKMENKEKWLISSLV